MRTLKKLFLSFMTLMIIMSFSAYAETYSSKKVTAIQIVTELQKTFRLSNIIDIKKGENLNVGQPKYGLKSKVNFTDKQYPKMNCSIEVLKNVNFVQKRIGYLWCAEDLCVYANTPIDFPTTYYTYKNILICLNGDMPKSREKQYLEAIKNIIL